MAPFFKAAGESEEGARTDEAVLHLESTRLDFLESDQPAPTFWTVIVDGVARRVPVQAVKNADGAEDWVCTVRVSGRSVHHRVSFESSTPNYEWNGVKWLKTE
jgi:hypothetical protein